MKVDFVKHWYGGTVPEKFQGKGPFEFTAEDFIALSEDNDVAIMHFKQLQPSRKELGRGAKPVPDLVGLCLDVKGGKFRQR